MQLMAEYDLERQASTAPSSLPPGFIGRYIEDEQYSDHSWHDGRPDGCWYKGCKLVAKRFRDGRPPRQCPVLEGKHMLACKHIEAQKEWRKRYREKRRMARLDLFLRDEKRIRWPAPPNWSHEDYIKAGATPIYRDGKIAGYQWEWDYDTSAPGFTNTVEDTVNRERR